MTASPMRLAVVGHTNTGKTSLVRTLTRDIGFGEISDRPATTRHAEAAVLLADGRAVAELVDTPGLEDPIGLYDHLAERLDDPRGDWPELLRGFVDGDHDGGRFEQEAKALRQVLACDAALYVIDARVRVLGKYRDELDILGRCAKPVIPVLNFVADDQSRAAEWREQLARLGLHAVAEFDTVALDTGSEQRLFETMRVLLDGFRPTLDALIADRARIRADLIAAAADRLADLLLDAAAYTVVVPAGADREAAQAELRRVVTERERRCLADLLDLFGFRPDDLDADALPVRDGKWGLDPFNPEALAQFGIKLGSGAAVGAAAGLAVDVALGGASLGLAAVLGASAGALWSGISDQGQRVADALRGAAELRVGPESLRLLAVRQTQLIAALLRRGHAAQDRLHLPATSDDWISGDLPAPLVRARAHPEWSRLAAADPLAVETDSARLAAERELAKVLQDRLAGSL